jgi:hypothetical protein
MVDIGKTLQLALNLNPGDNLRRLRGSTLLRLSSKLSSFKSAVAAHDLRR